MGLLALILAEAGAGSVASGIMDTIAKAGLSIPNENTYPYARSWNPPVSFGVSLERYRGEVPSAALAKLPTNVGWAPSRW